MDGADTAGLLVEANREAFDANALRNFIESIVALLLRASANEVILLFAQADFNDKLARFATESNAQALYINKTRNAPLQDGALFRRRADMNSETVLRARCRL